MSADRIQKERMTVAICCFNAARHLRRLIDSIALLESPVPFEILVIDNNSSDDTRAVVDRLTEGSRIGIRYVFEAQQGIPYARNRAIEESQNSSYLAFIDADELPDKTWLSSAVRGLKDYSADCVGGQIIVDIPNQPNWMSDTVLLFLGKVDYGDEPLCIEDRTTPVWSGNIAYRTSVFTTGLRFDTRYNRKGAGIGGGSDGIMFREMLKRGLHIRYEPNMRIRHLIPESKIKRAYFLKLHYIAGKKSGLYEYQPKAGVPMIIGIPRFMYLQLLKKLSQALYLYLTRHREYLRETMNVTYQIGLMQGLQSRQKYTNGESLEQ